LKMRASLSVFAGRKIEEEEEQTTEFIDIA
jgi:hypothetical protein